MTGHFTSYENRTDHAPATLCAACLTTHEIEGFNAHVTDGAMRMAAYDTNAAKRPVNVTLNSDLVARARAEGLNLSALAEEAVAAALARIAKARFDAEIAQACRVHEQYLAEYGSLGDAIRSGGDADEPA